MGARAVRREENRLSELAGGDTGGLVAGWPASSSLARFSTDGSSITPGSRSGPAKSPPVRRAGRGSPRVGDPAECSVTTERRIAFKRSTKGDLAGVGAGAAADPLPSETSSATGATCWPSDVLVVISAGGAAPRGRPSAADPSAGGAHAQDLIATLQEAVAELRAIREALAAENRSTGEGNMGGRRA